MPIRLSEEQQQEVARQGDRPIEAFDPRTQKLYFLVPAAVFRRMEPLLRGELDIRETYAAQDAALAKIWSDPDLDDYGDYDLHKTKP